MTRNEILNRIEMLEDKIFDIKMGEHLTYEHYDKIRDYNKEIRALKEMLDK